uniref:Uncharacterized protein n=1 Tax=Knipowitschia caucasica TaxID=637954 RepID=A0AAV2MI96_KNICA
MKVLSPVVTGYKYHHYTLSAPSPLPDTLPLSGVKQSSGPPGGLKANSSVQHLGPAGDKAIPARPIQTAALPGP